MPRETIFTPYPNDPTDGPRPFQMEVGWQRGDQDVQVGVVSHDSMHIVDYLYSDVPSLTNIGFLILGSLDDDSGDLNESALAEALRRAAAAPQGSVERAEAALDIGRAVRNLMTAASPHVSTGVWWRPGRSQINDLIRLLRKARDAAYGRDE